MQPDQATPNQPQGNNPNQPQPNPQPGHARQVQRPANPGPQSPQQGPSNPQAFPNQASPATPAQSQSSQPGNQYQTPQNQTAQPNTQAQPATPNQPAAGGQVNQQTPTQPGAQNPNQPNQQATTYPGAQATGQAGSTAGTAMPQGPSQAVSPPEETPKDTSNSAQNTLQVAEVRDGMVIMRDGSLRSVVMCQSINFDLMSRQEQESVEQSYKGFLNSLNFPIQIFIRSRKVDLEDYLDRLNEIRMNQDNILLGLLMEDYINYVNYLVEAANIMDKQFFVIIPYYPSITTQAGLQTSMRKLTGLFSSEQSTITINETDFKKYRQELTQRTRMVVSGLQQMGIQAVSLNSQELIELYYGFYNPETASNQGLIDINRLESDVVTKQGQSAGGANQGGAQ